MSILTEFWQGARKRWVWYSSVYADTVKTSFFSTLLVPRVTDDKLYTIYNIWVRWKEAIKVTPGPFWKFGYFHSKRSERPHKRRLNALKKRQWVEQFVSAACYCIRYLLSILRITEKRHGGTEKQCSPKSANNDYLLLIHMMIIFAIYQFCLTVWPTVLNPLNSVYYHQWQRSHASH